MSVQLCISTMTLQQQSSQKMYEGLDKLYHFLFLCCNISPAAIHGSVLSVSFLLSLPSHLHPPNLPLAYCGVQRLLFFFPCLPRDWVKPCSSNMTAANFMWKAGTAVGATEQDLKMVSLSFSVSLPVVSLPHSSLALLQPPF